MKKNWALRIGALAFVLTLVTATLISGTFAKYTTEVTGSEQVRVAKFAFNLKDGKGNVLTEQDDATEFDIFSMTADTGVFGDGVNGDKFIAPGTSGPFELTVENLSEVDVAATFEFTEENNDSIPVYYTYGENTQRYSNILTGAYSEGEISGTYMSLDDLAIAMADAGSHIEATANDAVSVNYNLNWYWAYNSAGTQQTDAADTALGISYGETAPKVKLNIACTVTQLNE